MFKKIHRNGKNITICTVLEYLALISTFLFVLAGWLEMKGMQMIKDNYDVVMSVYRKDDDVDALFAQIDQEIVDEIESDPLVKEVDRHYLLSGRIENGSIIPSYFGKNDITALVIFEGKVQGVSEIQSLSVNSRSIYYIRVQITDMIAGTSGWLEENQSVLVARSFYGVAIDKPEVQKDDEVLMICRAYTFTDSANAIAVYGKSTIASYEWESNNSKRIPGFWYQDEPYCASIHKDTLLVFPEGCSDEEKQSMISDFLTGKGLSQINQLIENSKRNVSLMMISDFHHLYAYQNERLFIDEGTDIGKNDRNRRICLVSRKLAELNGWKIGDSISISLSHDHYDIGGYISPIPGVSDIDANELDFVREESFVVVGIYDYYSYNPFSDEWNTYSYNQIFIPILDEYIPSKQARTPFTYSFIVSGEDRDRFIDDLDVENKGYGLYFTSSRWDDVSMIINELGSRSRLLIVLSLAFLVIVTYVYLIVLFLFQGTDFHIRRIHGESFIGSCRSFFSLHCVSFLAAMIPFLLSIRPLIGIVDQNALLDSGNLQHNQLVLISIVFTLLMQFAAIVIFANKRDTICK